MTSCSLTCSLSVRRVLSNWLRGPKREFSQFSFWLSFTFCFVMFFEIYIFLFHACGESRIFVVNFTVWLLANWTVEIAKAGKSSSTSAQPHLYPRHIISWPIHTWNKQTNSHMRRLSLAPSLSVHAESQGQCALMLPGFVGETARMLSIGCHWLSKDTVTKTRPSVPRTPCSSPFLPVTYTLLAPANPLQVRHGLSSFVFPPFFKIWHKHKNNTWRYHIYVFFPAEKVNWEIHVLLRKIWHNCRVNDHHSWQIALHV